MYMEASSLSSPVEDSLCASGLGPLVTPVPSPYPWSCQAQDTLLWGFRAPSLLELGQYKSCLSSPPLLCLKIPGYQAGSWAIRIYSHSPGPLISVVGTQGCFHDTMAGLLGDPGPHK